MTFDQARIVLGVLTNDVRPPPSERNFGWVALEEVSLEEGTAKVRQAGLPEQMRRVHKFALDDVMGELFQKFFLYARQVRRIQLRDFIQHRSCNFPVGREHICT